MPLDFEATPLQQSDPERNITPDAINGEVAVDLHMSELERPAGDWELEQEATDTRKDLAAIFAASEVHAPAREAERNAEIRAFRPKGLRAFRGNAVATGYLNPDIDLKDAA